jgi:hypothetical protein
MGWGIGCVFAVQVINDEELLALIGSRKANREVMSWLFWSPVGPVI